MPYAIDLRNLPIGTDGVLPEAVPQDKRDLRTVGALTPERQALEDRLYEQQGLVARPIEREQPQEEKKEEPASKQKSEKMSSGKKAIEEKTTAQKQTPAKEEVLLGSELPTFDETFEKAKRGNKKAMSMLNWAAKTGGFNNGFEFGKDGKAYYKDDKGNLQEVDMETARTLYDRTAEAAIYYNRWRQAKMEQMRGQQPKLDRKAIATEYDPYVLESLRTRAILQSDPNGLIAYTKMPYGIENTAARTDYTRAGMALRQAKGAQAQQEKWVPQEDGSYLVVDKETERPLYATDLKGNTAPTQFAGNMAAYSDELKKLSKDLDEGETLHYAPRMGYYVVDKAGKPYPLTKYLAEKAGAEQPTGTAAKKKTKAVTEPKQEAVKTNPVAYNNIGTLRLDDR